MRNEANENRYLSLGVADISNESWKLGAML